jgi:enoyl-CoA hydratase/carnithine racemase
LSDERIAVALDGAVGRIEIRRPEKKNAIDTAMAGQIEIALADLEGDPSCKAIVIAGEGGDLSAGADLGERRSEPSETDVPRRTHSTMLRALFESRLPTVALVDGWAIGIGLGIIGAATFAVGGAQARFMLPETRLGYIPYAVVPYLTTRVAPEMVMLWSLRADTIGLDEALGHHLLTHASPDGDAAQAAAPILDAIVAMPRELVEDGLGIVRERRAPALGPFIDWGEKKMAEVVELMRMSEKEGPR